MPVAFEAGVLLAGFGSVFALFFVSRLFPGKQPRPIDVRVTDDRFVLVIEESDAAFDRTRVEQMLQEFHVVATEEQVISGGSKS